jgi:hypothetical protein
MESFEKSMVVNEDIRYFDPVLSDIERLKNIVETFISKNIFGFFSNQLASLKWHRLKMDNKT